jgi:transposase-like protein
MANTRPDGCPAEVVRTIAWGDPSWLRDSAQIERSCRVYLEQLRWPDGVSCLRCHAPHVGRLAARRRFYCRRCGYQFSVTTGTALHRSHLPVWKWFVTVELMLASPSGIPANQLAQVLGGSYKTAWFVEHRVRASLGRTRRRADEPRPRPVRTGGAAARIYDRSTVGPYHQMGLRYLAAYLTEGRWRAENRGNPQAFHDAVLALIEADPLEYGELTGVASAPSERNRAPAPARALPSNHDNSRKE